MTKIINLHREATFTVELSEKAVRALAVVGQFGQDALQKAVATVLSPSEAKMHAEGLADLQRVGGFASAPLQRLDDARAVIEGRKVAVHPPRPPTSGMIGAGEYSRSGDAKAAG